MNERDVFRSYGHVLTVKEREVFDLALRGLSQRSIALALGLTRSAVQSRIETGSKRLREAAEPQTAQSAEGGTA